MTPLTKNYQSPIKLNDITIALNVYVLKRKNKYNVAPKDD